MHLHIYFYFRCSSFKYMLQYTLMLSKIKQSKKPSSVENNDDILIENEDKMIQSSSEDETSEDSS